MLSHLPTANRIDLYATPIAMRFQASRLTKHFSDEPVLAGVDVTLERGQRVALVGPNGAGKTTLLRILAGRLEADGGAIDAPDGITLGYLSQQSDLPLDQTVWQVASQPLDALVALLHEAERLAEQIAGTADAARSAQLGARYDALHEELQRRDAYHLDHRVERILQGIGLPKSCWHAAVGHLSGGQQNRLALARILIDEPDIMLLDEPSNHLDLETTQWLETYLAQPRHTLILISHDRYLIDKVATDVWELYQGTVDSYRGNFSAYVRQKEERLKVTERTYERQQEEIAKLQDFIRRHHSGQKHAQAEDRRKKLERIEPVAPPRRIAAPPMRFPSVARSGDIVLRIERLSHGFDASLLFENLSFDVLRGERWGIVGANGTGKTTLLRCLVGELDPRHGNVIVGTGVQVAYFDQQLTHWDLGQEAVEAIRPPRKEMLEPARRDLLARFGIVGDMAFQPLRTLSGGERAKVALARLAASEANLLVLDEPTNHLDLWSRQALESAIKAFQGTLVFVSHDRYFLNQIADHLIVFEPHRQRLVEGNYDTYRQLSETVWSEPLGAESQAAGSKKNRRRSERRAGGRPRRQFPYRKIEEIESDIAEYESRIAALHEELGKPETARDGDRIKARMAELKDAEERLAELYAHWEEACELDG